MRLGKGVDGPEECESDGGHKGEDGDDQPHQACHEEGQAGDDEEPQGDDPRPVGKALFLGKEKEEREDGHDDADDDQRDGDDDHREARVGVQPLDPESPGVVEDKVQRARRDHRYVS